MKTLILVIIAVSITGCAMTPEQQTAFYQSSVAFRDAGANTMNAAAMYNSQPQYTYCNGYYCW